jgi:hypothetical protein
MTTPADETFDGVPSDPAGVVGANTIGGFVYEGHRSDPGGAGDLATAVVNSAANQVNIGSGQSIWFNYGYIFTSDYWQFHSSALSDNFRLVSLAIESVSGGFSDVLTIGGYDDGVLVASATVDLNTAGAYGSISYAKLGAAIGGTLNFGAGWSNVDTIRFAGQPGDPYGAEFFLDDIDISLPPPTVAISMSDSALKVGDTALVTFAFSQAVSGFANADLSAIDNGSLTAVQSADGGVTWTATFTPSASLEDATNLITLNTAGVVNADGTAGVGSISSANYAIDTLRPSVSSLVVGDSSLSAGETAQVTIVFSEAVSGFTLADLSAGSASLSALASSDGGVSWTATLTPAASTDSVSNVVSLANSGVADLAGNAGAGTSSSANYTVDTLRPTATIVLADTALKIGETSDVAITFSEAVIGFALTDLSSVNGTLSGLTTADNITFHATFTPSAGVSDATNLLTLDNTGLSDAAGNTGTGITNSNNYAIDNVRPTATVSMSDSLLTIGETSTVTVAFSEAVPGFSNAALVVSNGSLSAVATADGGLTWAATFTPSATVDDASNIVTLDNSVTTDTAGNTGLGSTSSSNYAVDTVRPVTQSIVVGDAALTAGETSVVTITFSRAVTGLAAGDFTVASGSIGSLASVDGGITWTALLTPANGVDDDSNLITLDNSGVASLDGNAGAGTLDSNNYTVHTVRPTATIALADASLVAGETSAVTITFSEAVTDLTLADLSVANGTLSTPTTADGITWSATLTPTDGLADASNVITLDNSGVFNATGNAGAGSTTSGNYAINTVRPSATVTLADSALAAGETSTVTITFDGAVAGFDNTDLTAPSGTLSAVGSSDGGITWSATFTPSAALEDATNVITLDKTGVVNAGGNAGVGVSQSANYAVDTLLPTVSGMMLSDSTLIAGETAQLTIVFSEAVSGLTASDLTIGSGSVSAPTSADGGITWTATLTPAAATEDGSNLVDLALAGVADMAGNAGSGTSSSANYTVSTSVPTATVVVADNSLLAGETSTVAIAFSQAVVGLDLADFSVANGALSALASADGGISWTATLTPAASVDDPSNLITLDNTGYTSASGNAGAGSTDSNNYTVATTRPSATVTLSQSTLTSGQSALVTITFSEPVSGFSNADLTFAGATLGAVASSDGGLTWSATLTPDADTSVSSAVTLDTAGVLDASGNAGNTLAVSTTYQVDTALPPSGPPIVVIDGAPTTTVVVHDPLTGLDQAVLDVPLIVSLPPDPVTGLPGVADIPIGIAPVQGGVHTELVVGLPAGAGMQADGPTTLLSNAQALADLISRIEHKTVAGSAAQADMSGQGSSFLHTLAPDVVLETRTLVLSAGANLAPGQAIVISGGSTLPAPGAHNPSAIGLVIDASALPSGAVLQLDNVDFAAIVGAATVRGGAGQNVVVGDDAAQNLLLGAGDDLIAGGGGNDVLGGGAGNDRVDGGSGNDVLQGGRSDSGEWEFFLDSTGALVAKHAMSAFAPGAVETVQLGELNRDAAGLGFLGAKPSQLTELALLYHAAFGRAPDLGGLDYYAQDGMSAASVMQTFLASPEWSASGNGGLDDSAFVQKMYQQVLGRSAEDAGLAYWVGQLQGAGGAPLSRAAVLTAMALGAENRSAVGSADGIAIGKGQLAHETGWFAGSGDDRLDGGAGSDLLVGGDGVDTVVYAGKQADYHFLLGRDGQLHVADQASGDLDTLLGIEKGAFSDGVIDLSFTQATVGSLQTIGLMFQAVLDRPADAAGMAYWLGQHLDAAQLARGVTGSAEFKAHYGSMDDAHFVAALFANSHLTGAQASWESYLGSHSRADLIGAWVSDPAVADAQFGGQGLWIV